MQLKNQLGNPVKIKDTFFAKGGEGSVYEIVGNYNLVAKIYHPDRRTPEREKKLKAMLKMPPAKSGKGKIAWPQEVLYSSNNQFMGFVMPRVKSFHKIDELYSFDKRNDIPYSFYVQVAKNLCAAVQTVHDSGHVCGDLNPANICVDKRTALVTLVDTDSYHIRAANGVEYRCPVCRLEYAPPEIAKLMNMNENLRDTSFRTFNKYTDYFALAIHVFALLMNGCHPYAARIVDANYLHLDFPIADNILNGVFPFVDKETRVEPPLYSPSVSMLTDKLQHLCLRAFWKERYSKETDRPTPNEWFNALSDYNDTLIECNKIANHMYMKELSDCPFCQVERDIKKTGRGITKPTWKGRGGISANQLPKVFHFVGRVLKFVFAIPLKILVFLFYFIIGIIDEFSFLSSFIGLVFSAIVWLGVQYLAVTYLDPLIPKLWWGQIIRLIAVGVISNLPYLLWVLFEDIINTGAYDFFDGVDIFAELSFGVGMVAYMVYGVYTSWGTGVLSVVLHAILPPIMVLVVGLIITESSFYFLDDIIDLLPPFFGIVVAIAVWGAAQYFGLTYISNMNFTAWWGFPLRVVLLGVLPFAPLTIWLVLIALFDFDTFDGFFSGFNLILYYSYILTLIAYGGGTAYLMWGTGFLNVILNPILACLPATIVNKFYSSWLE